MQIVGQRLSESNRIVYMPTPNIVVSQGSHPPSLPKASSGRHQSAMYNRRNTVYPRAMRVKLMVTQSLTSICASLVLVKRPPRPPGSGTCTWNQPPSQSYDSSRAHKLEVHLQFDDILRPSFHSCNFFSLRSLPRWLSFWEPSL